LTKRGGATRTSKRTRTASGSACTARGGTAVPAAGPHTDIRPGLYTLIRMLSSAGSSSGGGGSSTSTSTTAPALPPAPVALTASAGHLEGEPAGRRTCARRRGQRWPRPFKRRGLQFRPWVAVGAGAGMGAAEAGGGAGRAGAACRGGGGGGGGRVLGAPRGGGGGGGGGGPREDPGYARGERQGLAPEEAAAAAIDGTGRRTRTCTCGACSGAVPAAASPEAAAGG
jgi:hypothetical protein